MYYDYMTLYYSVHIHNRAKLVRNNPDQVNDDHYQTNYLWFQHYIIILLLGFLKAHLHGIPEVVSVLRNEAIAHVSGMQSSCKGHNIIVCSASKQYNL